MSDCTIRWWTTQKRFEIELLFVTKLQGDQFDIRYAISNVIPHDLEFRFESQILKSAILLKFKVNVMHISTVNIWQMVTDRVNITISIKQQVMYGLSIGAITFYLNNNNTNLLRPVMVVWSTSHQGRLVILMMMGRECSRRNQSNISFACTGCYQLHPHYRLDIDIPDLSPIPILLPRRGNSLVRQGKLYAYNCCPRLLHN